MDSNSETLDNDTVALTTSPSPLSQPEKYLRYLLPAVVVAQLVERSLPTPEIAVRIPTSANFIYQLYIEIEKTKIKKKSPGMVHLKKRYLLLVILPVPIVMRSHLRVPQALRKSMLIYPAMVGHLPPFFLGLDIIAIMFCSWFAPPQKKCVKNWIRKPINTFRTASRWAATRSGATSTATWSTPSSARGRCRGFDVQPRVNLDIDIFGN